MGVRVISIKYIYHVLDGCWKLHRDLERNWSGIAFYGTVWSASNACIGWLLKSWLRSETPLERHGILWRSMISIKHIKLSECAGWLSHRDLNRDLECYGILCRGMRIRYILIIYSAVVEIFIAVTKSMYVITWCKDIGKQCIPECISIICFIFAHVWNSFIYQGAVCGIRHCLPTWIGNTHFYPASLPCQWYHCSIPMPKFKFDSGYFHSILTTSFWAISLPPKLGRHM